MAKRFSTPLAILLLAAGTATAQEVVLQAGTSVADALERLRSHGLRVIYSSALVPRSLIVEEGIVGDDPVSVARTVLEPHGLTLRALASNVFGVVESRSDPRWVLNGRVINAEADQPVPRARIEIVERGYVGWSGDDGTFALRMSGRGESTLTVLAEGYAVESQRVRYAGSKTGTMEVRLTPTPVLLGEVTIVSSRYTYDEVAAPSSFSLDQSDIIAQPKIAEDALQAMARLPGMAFSGISARPNIRGGEAGEMLVMLDGMPIREAFHLPDYNSAFSTIDEALVARLDAFTGPLPARYGNRLAAVVELESAPADGPLMSTIAASTFNARLGTGRRYEGIGTSEWLASGRLGTARLWIDDFSPDIGLPSYGDFFVKAVRAQDAGNDVRASGFWSGSQLKYYDPDTTESAELGSHVTYLWLSGRRTISDRLNVEGLLGFSNIRSDRQGRLAEGLASEGRLREERSSQIWDASVSATFEASARHLLKGGLGASIGRGRHRHASSVTFDPVSRLLFDIPAERARHVDLAVDRSFASAFLSDRWHFRPRWYLESGLRLDRDLEGIAQAETHLSPRIALRWDAGPATTLRVSWGRAYQSSEVHELRVEDGEESFLPPQRSDQWVVSAEHRLPGGASLRLEGFHRRMPRPRARFENLFDPLRLMPDLSADRIAIFPQASRMKGLEASMQFERASWSAWGAYTWSRAEDRIGDRWVPRDWDQRHTVAAALSWHRGPWTAAVFGAFHTGRPQTPLLDASLESPLLGLRNSQRMGSFVNVDVRVAREFAVAKGRLTAFAQVTNVFNRANRCCAELDLPDEDSDERMLEYETVQTYPLLPAVGVQWDF